MTLQIHSVNVWPGFDWLDEDPEIAEVLKGRIEQLPFVLHVGCTGIIMLDCENFQQIPSMMEELEEHLAAPIAEGEGVSGLLYDQGKYDFYHRDTLRTTCILRQANLCVVCGHGMYGDAQVHEGIVKRGDLPADPRIFHEYNCCALHSGCHQNTKAVDQACVEYLLAEYGADTLAGWLLGLGMKKLPARAEWIVLQSQLKE